MAHPRILAVFPDHPWPPDMGSRVRNHRILEALAGSFDLTIVSLIHDRALLADPGPPGRLGRFVPVLASHRRGALPWVAWHLRARAASWFNGLHPETFFQSLPVLARAVRRELEDGRPQLVHAAYWYGLRRLRRFPRPPAWVVDTHDVQFERHRRLLGRASPKERREELEQLLRYDRIVAITQRDRETLESHLPPGRPPVEVIGMGLDLAHWRAEAVAPVLPPGPRVAFYGNLATSSNQAGARHFLRELLPALRREVPGVDALLIGGGLPDDLRTEACGTGVRATGFVEDPRPWLAAASVLALALRTGSGQRGRVVEAAALGIPVVGYPEALEGLELSEGEGILTARDPTEFAAHLGALLADPERSRRIGESGRRRVEETYGWEATYGRFPRLYRSLLAADEATSPIL